MKLRTRQVILSSALLLPLALAIATAPPFAATSRAQGPQRMVGPLFPVKVDSNENGVPDAGDESIPGSLSGNQLTINSRWQCGPSPNNIITFSNQDGAGRYRTGSRNNGSYTQTVTAASASQFSWTEQQFAGTTRTGSATLADFNGDGVVDQFMVVGSGVNVGLSFSFTQNSQDISIPWAQASAAGVDTTDTCGGNDPQIWIPLADTNGDGRGDTIVPDLDGNGQPDPQFLPSPPFTSPAVPSMGTWARVFLTLLLGGTAVWFLSRRNPALSPQV